MVYLTFLTPEKAEFGQFIKIWASLEDYAQAESYGNTERRRAFLMGRSLLRALLYKVTQKTDWKIAIQAGGKPYLVRSDGLQCPFVSISHTDNLVACALSFVDEVGIDVEYWRPRDFEALAEYAFDAAERAYLVDSGPAGFYQLWTLKEALAKAHGKSIFEVFHKKNYSVSPLSSQNNQPSKWSFFTIIPKNNYSLSCVVRKPNAWSEAKTDFVLSLLSG